MASATGVAQALGTVTSRMDKMESAIEQINNNAKETTRILEARSKLFSTMLEKLDLLTDPRKLSAPYTVAKGLCPSTPLALLKSTPPREHPAKRKAPATPMTPPGTQSPDVDPLADESAKADRSSHNPSIRDQSDHDNNPPLPTAGGGMA